MGDVLRMPGSWTDSTTVGRAPDRPTATSTTGPRRSSPTTDRPTRPAAVLVPEPHPSVEPLWRETVGTELRRARQERDERLCDVAQRAGVSTQYLSEIERGLKDPSSEILGAVAGALDLTVRELVIRTTRATGPVCLAG